MKEFDFRRFFQGAAIAATLAFAAPTVAAAQTAGDTGTVPVAVDDDVNEDDDMDLGWLGLLGLAGLLGLRRRDQHVHHVDQTTTRRP